MESGFFNNPQFAYNFPIPILRGPSGIPSTGQMMREASHMEIIHEFYQKSGLKQNSPQTIQDVLKTFTKLINHHYSLNQRKAFMFEDSMILYSWFLTNPHADESEIRKIINYIYDRYLFRDLPEAMGCIIGRLLIYRMENDEQRNQINNIIDKVYVLSKRDRSFCDMSKMMHMMLLGMWDKWGDRRVGFYNYQGWESFRTKEQSFEDFYETTLKEFRQIWEEFLFNNPKHQHEVIQFIRKATNFRDCDALKQSNNFVCLIYTIKFIVDEHRHKTKFSDVLIDTIDQVLCKISYLPVNKEFRYLNGFLILYKIVVREREMFKKGVPKMHLALRICHELYKNLGRFGKFYIGEFKEKINSETDFTKYYPELDEKLNSLVELKVLNQNASQFLRYGASLQTQKSPYTQIYKQLHTQSQKKSTPPEQRIIQAVNRAKPQILKYAQEKLANLQYLELFISLQTIHQTFLDKVRDLCNMVNDIEVRHQHVKSLYTWYGAAYLKIMKHICSDKNELRAGMFMSKDFIKQMHSELISRFTDLGMVDLDFKKLYDIIFQQYSIDDVVVIEFQGIYFGINDLFEMIEKLGGNVGNATSYYELKKLQKYYNTYVTRGYSVAKDPKREEARLEMRRIVVQIQQKKNMMHKRPEFKFVKSEENKQEFDTKWGDVMDLFKVKESLEYLSTYDNRHHLVKTSIFMMLSKMQEFGFSKSEYHEVFECIVTVLDHEELLLEIYANLMFTILNSNKPSLVEWGYKSLNLMRILLNDKWKSELSCGASTVKGILCIFERIRKIEIKKNRKKVILGKPVSITDSVSGKTLFQKEVQIQQSKIYEQYFSSIFEGNLLEVLCYGKQLASMKKFRQAVLVLEMVNHELKDIELRAEMGDMKRLDQCQLDRKKLEIKRAECDIALCDCYAVLLPEFRAIQHITKKRCIEEKMNHSQKVHFQNIHKRLQNKINQQPQIIQYDPSLIITIAQKIHQQYWQVHDKKWVEKGKKTTEFELKNNRKIFMHRIYEEITNHSMGELIKINTHEDFRIYYLEVVMAGILYKWFEEKENELDWRIQERKELIKEASEIEDEEEDIKEVRARKLAPEYFENFQLEKEKQFVELSFDELLRTNISLVLSPIDRLKILETMLLIDQINKRFNIETMRMHYQALLEGNKMGLLRTFNELSFNGEKYEAMNLLELEILQRHYFEIKDYQRVKAIARHMFEEKSLGMFGIEQKNYICWPQVFCYDLQAKLFDDNMSWDKNISQRWDEFGKLIDNDTELIVDDLRFPFSTLKNSKYLKEIKDKQPIRYGNLIKQLEKKIKQYFMLLRIVFGRMNLTCKTGVNIFRVLHKIFTKFFIPELVSKQVYIDFFFYYLRFFCESIDCKWLIIEGESQFTGEIKPIEKDRSRWILANNMDEEYMKQRTANTVILMLQNLEFIKHHFAYIVRSLDTDMKSNKNLILRKLLVDIIAKNPVENAWNLTFFKHYALKLPSDINKKNRITEKRVKKFEQMKKYIYEDDSEANTRFDAIIKSLYEEISFVIGEQKYEQLVEIPELFIQILETNACNVAGQEHFYFDETNAINFKMKEINKKIQMNRWRIPYPLDTKLWIKSVWDFGILGAGKSTPTRVEMLCRPYSEIKNGDPYKNEKNYVPSSAHDLQKSFILKYNFSKADFMVETSTANFFNEFGMLDKETTYSITNMSKYILIIEKIVVPHITLRELFERYCKIDFRALDKEALIFSRKNDIRATQNPDRAPDIYPGFYDYMKQEKHNPLAKEGEHVTLFKAFYKQGIEKWKNAEEWWKYISNFVRTLAQWSYLCCLTKLGDRHNGNILVSNAGKIIHIDYEYNFAQGLVLPLPEWAPFRLTDAMVTALGIFGEKGPFFGFFMDMARRFDANDEKTWKALANFLPEQIKFIQSTSKFENQDTEASFQERCEKVIDIARCDDLLRLMYRGWLPSL